MVMNINKLRSPIMAISAALLMSCLVSAAWTPQEPSREPATEKDRKQVLERLINQVQKNQKDTAQSPAAPKEQNQTASPAPAPSPVQRGNVKGVMLNFENADLYDVVNELSVTLGLTPILIDSAIKGSVNLQCSTHISKEELFPLFNLILKNNNAALVKEDGIYQIVPISSALKMGVEIIENLPKESEASDPGSEAKPKPAAPNTPTRSRSSRPPARTVPSDNQSSGDSRLATHVIRTEFIPVGDLIEPIKLFMTEGGAIMPYDRLNMLIITDYTDSVEKILEIVHLLDSNYLDPDLVELIKINNNASADVTEDLKSIFGSGSKDSATGISFISIDRLNSIFVMASSKRGLSEVKRWIEQLDAASGKKIQTYFYQVQNSTASAILMTISALYGGEDTSPPTTTGTGNQGAGGTSFNEGRGQQQAGGAFGGSGLNARNQSQYGAATSPFGNQNQGSYGSQAYNAGGNIGGYGSTAFSAGQQLGPQLNVRPTMTSQILRGGSFTGLQDIVRLVADDQNNSLVIQAMPADYLYLLETIKKLDILPRQVLIEARIYEIVLNNSFEFGISAFLQARGTAEDPNDRITGGALDSGLNANSYWFIGNSREMIATLHAISGKTKLKLLEAPSVLALDGTQASIVVGAEIPYPGESFTSAAGGSTTGVRYRNTGNTLLIEPRISASGFVTLTITQEVSQGSETQYGNQSAPSFNLARVMNTFTVKDGETVAIAGVISESLRNERNGVPLLSDIPILGYLFGDTKKQSDRTELIIMITPHVIRTVEKFEETTQRLKDTLRHVRKFVDEKEQERAQDLEDARKDRYKQEKKYMEQVKPPKAEKPEEQKK